MLLFERWQIANCARSGQPFFHVSQMTVNNSLVQQHLPLVERDNPAAQRGL